MAQKKESSQKSGTVASINNSLKKATTEMLFCLYCIKNLCTPMK